MNQSARPQARGLYDPRFEHDACGAGFIAHLKARRSHDLVARGIEIMRNLEHRGASGADEATGDGAGMMLQVPHGFLAEVCEECGIALPEPGAYAVGMVFLPRDAVEADRCVGMTDAAIREAGLTPLGWRDVPTDNADIGRTARLSEPRVRQVFVGRGESLADDAAFDRRLYVARKIAERNGREAGLAASSFYVCSLSARTIVYKGMLLAGQFEGYYPDLSDPRVETSIALVHQRYSTNTFPSWDLAHPFRHLCHNGEINTLRGNINWMRARERQFRSPLFGEDIHRLIPIIDDGLSDSACFDRAFELLLHTGRSLSHAMMMMIPEAWEHHESMPQYKKDFYAYHAEMVEPWDGPALVAFSDGVRVGAVLDRNGLRPARYLVTDDDLVIMASEIGVLPIPDERIVLKDRLRPGRMLLVDTEEGRIVGDEELKASICQRQPYGEWLKRSVVHLGDLPPAPAPPMPRDDQLLALQKAFGYTHEDLQRILRPMAEDAKEPVGSMGDDCPTAVLSDQPRLLYEYFKQIFAQVTNPPLDAIREEIVTSLRIGIGAEQDLFDETHLECRQLVLDQPILSDEQLESIRRLHLDALPSITLSTLVPAGATGQEVAEALTTLCEQASRAADRGDRILILSDRGVDAERMAIPALLACSAVHHHLIREGSRTKVAIVIESGEPRETHHFALLVGYGASALNPYLAFASVAELVEDGYIEGMDVPTACERYARAGAAGILKVMSKMGISTLESYRGAQIFQAIGIAREVIDAYFTGTPNPIHGIGLDEIADSTAQRHRSGFSARHSIASPTLPSGGHYQWQRDGERHLMSPEAIASLQLAARRNDPKAYREFARLVNDQARRLSTLRGLFRFRPDRPPVPLEEVEPASEIVKRFKSGAMSYGSISKEAHETLAIAMNRLGGKSNSGEGGEDPERFAPLPNGDSRSSAIKQVASGRFGVTSEYLVNARELQIKMAQGAKPGEGGQLPGHKVYEWIAKVRHSTPGVQLISPPPHHDIYSIEDLAQLIYDLRCANTEARISVKLVSEIGVGTVAAGVSKGHADVVLISGSDGGTGASPISSIKHAGLPWELGLAETQQTLMLNDLRSRIVVECDGRLRTGRDVAIACLLGAEEFGFATALLVTMGCTLQRKCHLDTCSVGIATQNETLRRNFAGKPEHVMNYLVFVAEELREIMAELGFRTVDDMVGRCELLETADAIDHWKAHGLDLAPVLAPPSAPEGAPRRRVTAQRHGVEDAYDARNLLERCAPAIERGQVVRVGLPISNTDRTVGAMLGSAVTRAHGGAGLPEDTIWLTFTGSAGQSFAAFTPPGLTFRLVGDSNDYFGKGLSGAKLIVNPPEPSPRVAEENVIIGNVALYGATSGEAFVRGLAGERFCVRNSGAVAVVEGIGDHGCEYMTGGRVVVLGPTGRNFAAGMSGGLAYVYDADGAFPSRCNREMVELDPVDDPEWLRWIVQRHVTHTDSALGKRLLRDWRAALERFVLVFPREYKRALREQAEQAAREEEARSAAVAHV